MNELVSVIIPTYNEKENITPLIQKINEALNNYKYEILIIDDNSQDGTADMALSLATKYPVRVIVRKDERGLASAVIHGFNQASGNILAVMDADLQHPPQYLVSMMTATAAGADLVIASRYIKGGGCEGWGLMRRIMSKGAIFLAHLLLPQTRRVSDPMSGYFMLSKSVVTRANLKPAGYKILLEVLMVGQYNSAVEVPYIFQVREKGASKLGTKQQIDYLRHLFSLMRRTGELVRFLKFCLVGASGVIVNEGLLWALRQFAGLPLALASGISIETAIISNFTLNDFFTFADRRAVGLLSFLHRFGKFNAVSLFGLGINMGTLLLLTNVFGLHYLISNLVGIAIAMLWNYLVNHWWTWK